MDLQGRIKAFSELGEIMRDSLDGKPSKYAIRLDQLIESQHLKNPWFTPENVRMAVKAIARELTIENLERWTAPYPAMNQVIKPQRIGVIMAGNIPLVGFHDFLSVLITGNTIVAKTSSKDSDLINFTGEILCDINDEFRDHISFTEGTLTGFDAVIATGSDNSSRYFEYYFGKYPHIIRRNRNSIAIIEGGENEDELEALGTDIFSYFGLGCRNVAKIYIPEGYDFSGMIRSWTKYSDLVNHSRYANNYDFSKAVYLVNKENFLDTGFLLFKDNKGFSSPVAVLYYEHYSNPGTLISDLENCKEKIQCIVGRKFIPFGKAQSPSLWDYADGTDTIEFLLKKK